MKKYFVIKDVVSGGYYNDYYKIFKGIMHSTKYCTKGTAESVIFGFGIGFGTSTYEIKEIYER